MLAANGGKVVVADMQAEKGEAIASEIGGAFVKCDVSQEADGQAVVAAAAGAGQADGPGQLRRHRAGREDRRQERRAPPGACSRKTITVNLIGSFNMIRLAAEAMCKNEPEATGERGVLISHRHRSPPTTARSARPPTAPPRAASSA